MANTMVSINQLSDAAHPGMVWIPGGTFLMGSDKHYPEEAPAHEVTVDGFWMDSHTVTNEEFRKFVDATKHVTSAERAPNPDDYPGAKPELLVPASVVFQKPKQQVSLNDCYQWWTYVPGANWRHPEGPASSLKGRAKHPVVQLAYEDVEAYAKWIGKELPTEAEWEFAARGGLAGAEFVWGVEFTPGGKHMANTWQGEFPWQNLKEDGFEGIAPVGSFPAERLRTLRHGRQRLGVDHGLVFGTRQDHASLLRRHQSQRRRTRTKLRSEYARHQDSAQSDERRLVFVRAELLPALPPRGAHGSAHRYFDVSSGV